MMDTLLDSPLAHLAVALTIGLLIGIERGWQKRESVEGTRIAGVRTFGLLGLLGGITALVTYHTDRLLFGFVFLAIAVMLTAVYLVNKKTSEDVGITTLVAALLTFALGALAGFGEFELAAAIAVLTALLLGLKVRLHRWIRGLQQEEMYAGIQLLLISVVLLPILPDRGYGPWSALNPYEIWWMVVLVATISFAGYFAIKIGGAQKGAVSTGFFAGMASSTALTLHFSHLAKLSHELAPAFATGILVACGNMFVRIIIVATIINRELFTLLALPFAVMTLIIFVPAFLYWRSLTHKSEKANIQLSNPLELKTAIGFGLLLSLIMLLGKATQEWFGDTGVLVLAAFSGLADVDAITLSMSRLSYNEITLELAATCIIFAASINTLVKAGIAGVTGKKAVFLRVSIPLILCAVCGIVVVLI